jgi:hypothetical protein
MPTLKLSPIFLLAPLAPRFTPPPASSIGIALAL